MLKEILLILFLAEQNYVSGSGKLMDPVNRGSRWRTNDTAPKNFNDDGSYCKQESPCGICGDKFTLPAPRPHELGGFYGEGIIVKNYRKGQIITAKVEIGLNDMGYFVFDLCNLDKHKLENKECFEMNPLMFRDDDGKDFRYLRPNSHNVDLQMNVTLPDQLTCKHCVLRWTWVNGNQFGPCENGNFDFGCGPQKIYQQCSDISIE